MSSEEKGGGFYYQLKKYRPICYSGKGVPTFLLLRERALSSLPCIVFINILFAMVIILEWAAPSGLDKQFNNIAKNVNILIVIFIDIFYTLTVTLNPGIVGKDDMESIGNGDTYSYCTRCQREINNDMTHCIECMTCVEDIDHHCSFFGKCIAGPQRFAFYGFITFVFIGFICLMGSLAVLLNPS